MLVPLIVACALFMESMDSTVIATSLPAIAADLGENPVALKLALTAYLVALAVFIPVSGWFADRYGARRVFATAIAVFMLGSLACAAPQRRPSVFTSATPQIANTPPATVARPGASTRRAKEKKTDRGETK